LEKLGTKCLHQNKNNTLDIWTAKKNQRKGGAGHFYYPIKKNSDLQDPHGRRRTGYTSEKETGTKKGDLGL